MPISTAALLVGVEEQRNKCPDDMHYVPKPPTMDMVKQAFEKKVEEATEDEKAAVLFFYKKIVATLDSTVTSDAMCGSTVMEALDRKSVMMQYKDKEKGVSKEAWKINNPNVWAFTMATAGVLLDPGSGASDTATIVHNMTKEKGQKTKRTKQFKKSSAVNLAFMYMNNYSYFTGIWKANKMGTKEGCAAVARLAAWDKYTKMTKEETESAAQKRN